MLVRLAAVSVIASCGSPPKTTEPVVLATKTAIAPDPLPTVELSFLAGTGPIAVGTPIAVYVKWDTSCVENGSSCDRGLLAVDVRCEACTSKMDAFMFHVTPTRPGRLQGSATIRTKQGTFRAVFPSTEVVVPDAATATCTPTIVTLELVHAGRPVRTAAPRLEADGTACTHEPVIDHGWPAPPPSSFRYTCPAHAKQLVVEAFRLVTRC